MKDAGLSPLICLSSFITLALPTTVWNTNILQTKCYLDLCHGCYTKGVRITPSLKMVAARLLWPIFSLQIAAWSHLQPYYIEKDSLYLESRCLDVLSWNLSRMNGPQRTAWLAKGYTNNLYTIKWTSQHPSIPAVPNPCIFNRVTCPTRQAWMEGQ